MGLPMGRPAIYRRSGRVEIRPPAEAYLLSLRKLWYRMRHAPPQRRHPPVPGDRRCPGRGSGPRRKRSAREATTPGSDVRMTARSDDRWRLLPADYQPAAPDRKDYGIGVIGCGGIMR